MKLSSFFVHGRLLLERSMKKFFLYQVLCSEPVIEVVAMLFAALFILLVRLTRDLVVEFLIANGEPLWLHSW